MQNHVMYFMKANKKGKRFLWYTVDSQLSGMVGKYISPDYLQKL